jgi:hypothetical protein
MGVFDCSVSLGGEPDPTVIGSTATEPEHGAAVEHVGKGW